MSCHIWKGETAAMALEWFANSLAQAAAAAASSALMLANSMQNL